MVPRNAASLRPSSAAGAAKTSASRPAPGASRRTGRLGETAARAGAWTGPRLRQCTGRPPPARSRPGRSARQSGTARAAPTSRAGPAVGQASRPRSAGKSRRDRSPACRAARQSRRTRCSRERPATSERRPGEACATSGSAWFRRNGIVIPGQHHPRHYDPREGREEIEADVLSHQHWTGAVSPLVTGNRSAAASHSKAIAALGSTGALIAAVATDRVTPLAPGTSGGYDPARSGARRALKVLIAPPVFRAVPPSNLRGRRRPSL